MVSRERTLKMLKQELAVVISMRKSFLSDMDKPPFNEKIKPYRHEAGRLFDVAACKCLETQCTCSSKNRLSKTVKDFLRDQRTFRAIKILPDSSHVIKQKTKRTSDTYDNDTFIDKKRHKAVENESDSGYYRK